MKTTAINRIEGHKRCPEGRVNGRNTAMKTLFIAVFLSFLMVSTVSAYTIDGNKVYIDDTRAYISAEPHTLHSSGWVTFTVTPKTYTGDIDVILGFNTTETKPKKAEYYNPTDYTIEHSYTCSPPYWYNYTASHLWCWYDVTDNTTGKTQPYLVFEHDFDRGNLTTNTIYWNVVKTTYWQNIASIFNKVNYNYDNKDTWYYTKNVHVTAGQTYVFRVWLDVPVRFGAITGKYDFAIKPSSETIQQAISNGHLYFIDPWWNLNYDYRYPIISPDNDTGLYYVNDSYGLNDGTGVQYILGSIDDWSETPYVYYDNDTHSYAIANTQRQFSTFIDEGNGTNYNNPLYITEAAFTVNMSTGTIIYDESNNGRHGTFSGSGGLTAKGIISNGWTMDSDSTRITLPGIPNTLKEGALMISYIPSETLNSTTGIDINNDRLYRFQNGIPGDVFFSYNDGRLKADAWCNRTPRDLSSNINEWNIGTLYNIYFWWNDTTVEMWVNGVLQDSCLHHLISGANRTNLDSLIIGYRAPTWPGVPEGTYDNFMAWANESTPSRNYGTRFYNNIHNNGYWTLGDRYPRLNYFDNITLISPANNSYITTENTGDFCFNYVGSYSTANCELRIVNESYGSITTTNNTNTCITADHNITTNGAYNWSIKCVNSPDFIISEQRIININIQQPQPQPPSITGNYIICEGDYLVQQRVQNVTINGVQNVTTEVIKTYCPNGCSDDNILNFGNSGCVQDEIVQWVVVLFLLVAVGIFMRWFFR